MVGNGKSEPETRNGDRHTPYGFASLDGQTPRSLAAHGAAALFCGWQYRTYRPRAISVRMWGRLAPGVSAKMAEQELKTLTNELRRQHPKDIWEDENIDSAGWPFAGDAARDVPGGGDGGSVDAVDFGSGVRESGRPAAGAGGDAGARDRDSGGDWCDTGADLQATSTESVVLALLGATAGLVAELAGLRIVLTQFHAPGWLSAKPDWRVLVFTFGMAWRRRCFSGLRQRCRLRGSGSAKLWFGKC